MSLRQKYRWILSGIIPAGAAGVSLLLGSTAPSAAADHHASAQPAAADRAGVSERLAAIRAAVSEMAAEGEQASHPPDGDLRLAQWWNNFWGPRRWGWPNWNNWRNWNNWNNWWRNW
jgi:hypothetical protein